MIVFGLSEHDRTGSFKKNKNKNEYDGTKVAFGDYKESNEKKTII